MIRKLLKYLALLFAVLVGALLVVLLVVDFDEVINDQVQQHRPRIEAALGRSVEIGPIKATMFPLGAEVQGIEVRGRTPEEAPLLSLKRAHFRVDLWRALISAGTDTRLDELELDGLVLNLIREPDGSLSYEDVLRRLAEGPPPDEAPEPLSAEQRQRLQNLVLDRVALVNSTINLEDRTPASGPAKTYVRDLSVVLEDVALVSAFEIRLRAAVVADAENLDVRVRLGPIPFEEGGALPIHQVRLEAEGIDLGRLAPYLGGAVPVAISSARLGADLTITDPLAAAGSAEVKGRITIAGLALGTPPGKAFALDLAPNVVFAPAADTLTLTGFRLALDDMELSADGAISALSTRTPRFDGVKIRTSGFDLDRLQAMLPDLERALPEGSKLGGPFAVALEATGTAEQQAFTADVDFDRATLMVPGALSKPAGVALHLRTRADMSPDSLTLHRFALGLGPMALSLSGSVKNFVHPVVNLQGDTGRFDINGLVRLIPSVRAALPPDVRVAGEAAVKLAIKGTPSQMKGDARVGVYGADLGLPGAVLKGTGEVVAQVNGTPGAALNLIIDTDLKAMDIRAGEAFVKPVGTALSVHATGTQVPEGLHLKTLDLDLGPLQVDGEVFIGRGGHHVDVTIGRFEVAALARLLPALRESPLAQATLGMKLFADGVGSRPRDFEARVRDLYFSQGKNQLTGELELENLEAPRVRFALASDYLDLDALLPASEDAAAPEAEGPPQIPPIVKAIDGSGGLRIKRGIFGGIPVTDFVGQLSLKGGVLRFTALEFDGYDGHFTGTGTEADLGAVPPTFHLVMALKDVDAGRLLAEQAKMKRAVTGRLTTTMDIKGRGLVWEEMSQSLTGDLGLALAKGRLEGLQVETDVLGPVAALLPLLGTAQMEKGTSFESLAGSFALADGKLRLKEPMVIGRDRGELRLEGGVGLDKSLDLTGTVALTPKLLALVSGGKLAVKRPVPVAIKIGGTVMKPEITGVEVKRLASDLAAAAGLGSLEALEERARAEAGKRIDEAKAAAEAKVNEARAAAEAKVAAAKKQAEDKADAAKAEARRRAEAAKKKAADAAKKKARGVMDKLF